MDNIHSPADIKGLDFVQLRTLCSEIRSFLIDSVSQTGGHLSSNLGTIELTVALHRVFDTPVDKIVWDVGHQSYTHKILTGRKEGFARLRMLDGLSGFPSPKESKHDAFIAGHGNTSISAAIGIAQAKKIKGEPGKVIAIVGDGAFTGGMIYEGMNNIRKLDNLIVILNDNKMSISKNVGSIAQYMTKLRTSPHYFKTKRDVKSFLSHVPLIGEPISMAIQTTKTMFRRAVYHSTMFEEMGFQYTGPVDGHDVQELVEMLSVYREEQSAPLFIHVLTVKGKGFVPAEENPGEYHGISAVNPDHIADPDDAPSASFSMVFGKKLAELGEENKNICAITAAMKYGTGLQFFYRRYKERFFDVGMAEQHAVTFAAGLASDGMIPVVAIYSTFLQRSYDQIIHDVNLQNLNVLFAIDRAGFVPADGETHQGIYDAAFLSQFSGFRIVSPCNYEELLYWLEKLITEKGPRALRYPRGSEDSLLADYGCSKKEYDFISDNPQAEIAVVTYGAQTKEVLKAVSLAKEQGVSADIYKMTVIHPLPDGLCEALMKYRSVIFAEEGIRSGGIGEHLAAALYERNCKAKYCHIAADGREMTHATADELRARFGLDAASLAALITESRDENK